MLWTAFALGLAGSLHCAGMCGPLALALPSTGSGRIGFTTGRLCYQGGRVITYALMGLLFGLLGQSLALTGIQRWISVTGGVLMLVGLALSSRPFFGVAITWGVQGLKSVFQQVLIQRSAVSMGILGLLNGLLPCGLVYAACAGAAATGNVLHGVAYMALFGAGTIPVMLGIGLSGHAIPMALRLRLTRLVPATVATVGVLLVLRGLALGIPYVSPGPSPAAAAAASCH
ncbi:MAG: sulfite exporter TauE/SafE family protein [Verrucomicrobiae bacterium]|nr:sulfite exporter TauE/SafE family protein [Verrucomicrobiae bacterium]